MLVLIICWFAFTGVSDLVTKPTYLNESKEHSQYLMGYRVNRCEDFLTDKGCSSNNCFNYHHPNSERCYHLSVYKTQLCNKAECNNLHCAFAHGKSDMRAPIFSRGDPRVTT